jgi:hypothetical protein
MSSDKKISQLGILGGKPAGADLFPFVNFESGETMAVSYNTIIKKDYGVMYLKDNDLITPIDEIGARNVVVGNIQTGLLNNFVKDVSTNSLKYIGPGGVFYITVSFNFYEGNQRTCGFYIGHNKNDLTPLNPNDDRIDESEIYANSNNPSSQPISSTIQTLVELNTHDRVFFIVQNKDGNSGITVEFMKLITIQI